LLSKREKPLFGVERGKTIWGAFTPNRVFFREEISVSERKSMDTEKNICEYGQV
jgi:hypothetical protein